MYTEVTKLLLEYGGTIKVLTLLVPGVDSSRVPGFFREFFLSILYYYGKSIGNHPNKHIYLER
jgi:hypothetical protein